MCSSMTYTYLYQILIDSRLRKLFTGPSIIERVSMYKKVAADLVFHSPQLHQMEFKGNKMIEMMFNVFKENYIEQLKGFKLLPNFTDQLLQNEKNKTDRARIVCDYISGMTDSFALTNYKRLFDPDYSSIADIY